MSGSEHARPTRCIWLTSDQRNDLARLVNDYLGHALSETPLAVVDAWDAAPADPKLTAVKAAREYVVPRFLEETPVDAAEMAHAVLRALGAPE